MGVGCKLLSPEGDFKVDVNRGQKVPYTLKRLIHNYHTSPAIWRLVGVVLLQVTSWFFFAILWLLISHRTPQDALGHFDTFANALKFSISLQLHMGFVEASINPQSHLAVTLCLLQSLTAFVLRGLFLVSIINVVIRLIVAREKIEKIKIDENLIFHKEVNKEAIETPKPSVKVAEKKTGSGAERRGSLVAYRRGSIFGRRASKAEGHRFCRQKATKSSRYQKLKGKKVAKGSAEIFKMMVSLEEEEEERMIKLATHGFLLVKKRFKTALMDVLELLATKEINFQEEETFQNECEDCSNGKASKNLVHTIDEDSALIPFMDFIFRKKKWDQKADLAQASSSNAKKIEAAKPDLDFITLWPDESINVSKMELEVVVVVQYQHIDSSCSSETRKSFDLSNFKLHSSLENSEDTIY